MLCKCSGNVLIGYYRFTAFHRQLALDHIGTRPFFKGLNYCIYFFPLLQANCLTPSELSNLKLHQHTWCHWHRQLTLTIFGTLINAMECSAKQSCKAVTASNTASSSGRRCAEWLCTQSMSLQVSAHQGESPIATMTLSPTEAETKRMMKGECPLLSSCCPTPTSQMPLA